MIELSQITKTYTSASGSFNVFENFDLTIAKGECVVFRAPSGGGKTTLCNMIGGMLQPTAGTVTVDGTELTRLSSHFLAQYRRDNIGFIFQQFHLISGFSVIDNITLPLIPNGRITAEQEQRLHFLLGKLQLNERVNFNVNTLSGGEQQRVAVARALINQPKIIIADEPFSQLDEANIQFIQEIFKELKEKKINIIIATHGDSFSTSDLVDREIQLCS